MALEVEAAPRKMKNGKETGKDQVNIETLKAGDETIAKQIANLYTKRITERRIHKTWKEVNMVIFVKKGNRKDIKNYRQIFLLYNLYKLFTEIITTKQENYNIMLQELSDESWRMGLRMNIAKTKVMVVDTTPINVNHVLIENVQGYVYLGQHYSLKETNQDKDI